MTTFVTTTYVSRICDAPPLVARAGLAEFVRRHPVVETTDWTLRFTRPAAAAAPAVMTVGWALRAAVFVEVEPWSRDRVLIGLRHRARAAPWWTDAYFTAAHDAAALLTDWLETWAEEPLRTLMAGRGLIRLA